MPGTSHLSLAISGVTVSEFDQNKELTRAKKAPGFEWIGEVHSQVLQDVVRRVRLSFDHFFRGGGFPKLARKFGYHSFCFPQAHHGSICIEGNKIRLPKIGWVRFYQHRPRRGRIKQVRIKKQPEGYFICISVEQEHEAIPASENQAVGVDLGIARLATLSTGERFENPGLFEQFSSKLKRLQRKLSRQVPGSNSRKKTRRRLGRLHARIRRCRRDCLHRVPTQIVGRYSGVTVEDLRIKDMTGSARGTPAQPGKRVKQKSGLNRSLLDVSPGRFVQMLAYKCQWNERRFERVGPKYTSQKCSGCGHTSADNRPSQAVFCCVNCGHREHADVNAAKNIRDLGRVSGREYEQGLRALPVSA